mgnify:CR=1 FL=1
MSSKICSREWRRSAFLFITQQWIVGFGFVSMLLTVLVGMQRGYPWWRIVLGSLLVVSASFAAGFLVGKLVDHLCGIMPKQQGFLFVSVRMSLILVFFSCFAALSFAYLPAPMEPILLFMAFSAALASAGIAPRV